jgi:hypothetical protein
MVGGVHGQDMHAIHPLMLVGLAQAFGWAVLLAHGPKLDAVSLAVFAALILTGLAGLYGDRR